MKGTLANPSADPPLRPDGKLNVGAAVGRGVLAVVRSHPQNEHPYQGMIPIATGEVAEDLARYLADSEQTNSALGLGVAINRDASIRSAGGFLIQVDLQIKAHINTDIIATSEYVLAGCSGSCACIAATMFVADSVPVCSASRC